jgi:hypothetical protein
MLARGHMACSNELVVDRCNQVIPYTQQQDSSSVALYLLPLPTQLGLALADKQCQQDDNSCVTLPSMPVCKGALLVELCLVTGSAELRDRGASANLCISLSKNSDGSAFCMTSEYTWVLVQHFMSIIYGDNV